MTIDIIFIKTRVMRPCLLMVLALLSAPELGQAYFLSPNLAGVFARPGCESELSSQRQLQDVVLDHMGFQPDQLALVPLNEIRQGLAALSLDATDPKWNPLEEMGKILRPFENPLVARVKEDLGVSIIGDPPRIVLAIFADNPRTDDWSAKLIPGGRPWGALYIPAPPRNDPDSLTHWLNLLTGCMGGLYGKFLHEEWLGANKVLAEHALPTTELPVDIYHLGDAFAQLSWAYFTSLMTPDREPDVFFEAMIASILDKGGRAASNLDALFELLRLKGPGARTRFVQKTTAMLRGVAMAREILDFSSTYPGSLLTYTEPAENPSQ